ncbi:MAG TPA: phage terminase large subunit [Candidatus Acidoferrales bacterium]
MAEIIFSVKRRVLDQAEAAAKDSVHTEPGEANTRPGEYGVGERSWLECNLNYEPFPKQSQFHSSPAKYRLFGGAAGPGKTKALLMEAVVQALTHPNVNTLLLRRTFPELEASLLHYFRRDVPRNLYLAFHESKHLVEWANGSTTRFGYCASERDVYQYQGAEYLFIGIDELTLFTLRQWQFLTSRNRCPVPGTFACMAGATNPGNIGHAWVKALWIDKQPAPGMERPEEYNVKDYDFIPARFFDNPIYAADQNYQKTLLALPTNLKRAFFDGDWEVFAGQYFDRFDLGRNTARAEEIEWQPWWPRWISIDWGFEHPAATYWHAQAPASLSAVAAAKDGDSYVSADAGARPNSCVITYREYVTHRTSPRELAREIIARSVASSQQSGAEGFSPGASPLQAFETGREKIGAIYLSPDAFARRTDDASIAEQMGNVLAAAGFPRPTPADDDRIGGWMLMYQMLDAGEWLLTDNCVELIRTLPTLVRDSARIEDVEKMDGDDAADAARYGLISRYAARRSGLVRPPWEQRLAERVTSADPTIRAIQARKAQLEETKRVHPVSFLRRRRT